MFYGSPTDQVVNRLKTGLNCYGNDCSHSLDSRSIIVLKQNTLIIHFPVNTFSQVWWGMVLPCMKNKERKFSHRATSYKAIHP